MCLRHKKKDTATEFPGSMLKPGQVLVWYCRTYDITESPPLLNWNYWFITLLRWRDTDVKERKRDRKEASVLKQQMRGFLLYTQQWVKGWHSWGSTCGFIMTGRWDNNVPIRRVLNLLCCVGGEAQTSHKPVCEQMFMHIVEVIHMVHSIVATTWLTPKVKLVFKSRN